MSICIEGWIEVALCEPGEHGPDVSSWSGLVNLGALHLFWDDVSEVLFGLSRKPLSGIELFVARGLPSDPSSEVANWHAANEQFVAKHGEGAYGHTYATWSEISAVDFNAWSVDLTQSDWRHVFAMVDTILRSGWYPSDQIRIVVAGTW
jgi:hypothetical protein